MSSERMDSRSGGARGAVLVGIAAVLVGSAGSLATGRTSFVVSALAAAAVGYGTLAYASARGRDAIRSGRASQAGVLAGVLLAVRLLGVAALMVIATVAPAALDLWGVLAGLVAADATMLVLVGSRPRPTAGTRAASSREGR